MQPTPHRWTIYAVFMFLVALTIPTLLKQSTERDSTITRLLQRFTGTTMTTTETYEQSKSRWGFDVNLVRRASYEDLEFDFTGPTHLLTPVTSTKVTIELTPLPGFHYPVIQARGKNKSTPVASVDTDWEPASMKGSNVQTTFTRTNMATTDDKLADYTSFLSGLILSSSYTYELIGTTDVIVRLSVPGASMLPYGDSAPKKDITISGIGVSTSITLGGFEGFKTLEVVDLPTLQKTGATGYALTLNLNFKSPSPEITMRFGDVTLRAVNSAGAAVGTILLRDWTVKPGNDNPVTAVLTGDSAEGLQVVSTLTTTGDTFTLSGFKGSSKNLGVAGALAGVKIDLFIPAAKEV
ncbi:hypothetical protein BG015_008879 [Linnemannia schmuckeri]|uniref:Uncharacterized protein n=1 Tax=Linnemannia schmuckeri TaxID=64567 RepID=A0A9P5VA65_9FUNG|nr:hypothetical protein BG015_008879 [Linnemannia schmuckeri]